MVCPNGGLKDSICEVFGPSETLGSGKVGGGRSKGVFLGLFLSFWAWLDNNHCLALSVLKRGGFFFELPGVVGGGFVGLGFWGGVVVRLPETELKCFH